MHIDLHHLFAGSLTRVGDGDTEGESVALTGDLGFGVVKGGVTQPIAEGISHLLVESVKIAVAHIDALFVLGIGDAFDRTAAVLKPLVRIHVIVLREVACGPVVIDRHGPGHGQSSAGVGVTCDYVRHGVAAFLSGLPCHENGIHTVAPRDGLDDRTRVDDHQDGFVHLVEDVAHAGNEGLLEVGQGELSGYLSVNALSCLTRNGDDSGTGLLGLMANATLGNLHLVQLGLSLIQEPHERVLVDSQFDAGIGHILLIDIGQQRCGGESLLGQGSHHVRHLLHIDAAGAYTAGEEVITVKK